MKQQKEQSRVAPRSRRWLSLIVGLCIANLTASVRANEPAETKSHTNVVFILVDDLGWTDLGCFGSGFYRTPNLDQFANTAMKFNQAYAACQVCSPTRASILTGKYPQRVGITDYINAAGGNQPEKWKRKTKMLPAAYSDHLALEEVTIAEKFKQAGYATFFAGKWHLGGEGFWPRIRVSTSIRAASIGADRMEAKSTSHPMGIRD